MLLVWRAERRLRQLSSVSARGLQVEPGGGAFFTLYVPCPSGEDSKPAPAGAAREQQLQRQWRALYRSEAVYGTINPEWEPPSIEYGDAVPKAANAAVVLVAVHVLPATAEAPDGELERPATIPADAAPTLRLSVSEGDHSSDGSGRRRDHGAGPPHLAPVADERPAAAAAAGLAVGNGHANGTAAAVAEAADLLGEMEPQLSSAFPGTVCAAWRLRLAQLHPLGSDLGALPDPLQPGSLVLEFADGQYYSNVPPMPHLPPPSPAPSAQQSAAPSYAATPAASPVKQTPLKPGLAAAAAEEADTQSAAGAAGANEGDLTPTASSASAAAASSAQSLGGLLLSTLRLSNPDVAASSAPSTPPGHEEESGEEEGSGGQSSEDVAAAAVAAAGPLARPVSVSQLREQVGLLIELQRSVREAHARCERLEGEAARWLAQREAAGRQASQLAAVDAEGEEAARLAGVAGRRAEAARQAVAAAKRSAVVNAQGLSAALKALQGAGRRVREAAASLRGDQGSGRLRAALREAIGRRCAMAAQAGWAYRLGPTAVRVLRPPPGGLLETQLESAWAGGAGSESGEALLLTSDAAAAGLGKGAESGGGGAVPLSALCRQEIHLSIGGLELVPSVWRKAFDADGYEWDAGEDRAAAVALGYVAHLVERLAVYCDVPLRYPISFQGSTSTIFDNYPPSGAWPGDEPEPPQSAASSLLFGRTGGGAAARPSAAPVEYPLHCASNRDRPRFAVGVFLLNKDVIQLLQAHGITAAGPNELLQNLHKLVACAEAGMAPGSGGTAQYTGRPGGGVW